MKRKNKFSHLYLILPFRFFRGYVYISLSLFLFSCPKFPNCFLNIDFVTLAGLRHFKDSKHRITLLYPSQCIPEPRENYFKMLMSTSFLIVDEPKDHTTFYP